MNVKSHGELGQLRRWLATLSEFDLVAVVSDTVLPLSHDWPWEALGLFELYPDAVVVGGRVFDAAGRIESAGEIFGVGGLLGTPDWGRHDGHMGHYGLHICQRSVDAVSAEFFIARAALLREVLADSRVSGWELFAAWLGALARERGKRVIYTPHIAAQRIETNWEGPLLTESRRFEQAFGRLRLDDRHYSRHYSRDPEYGYYLAPRPFARDHVKAPLLRRLLTSSRA